jgi:hypothetical protein
MYDSINKRSQAANAEAVANERDGRDAIQQGGLIASSPDSTVAVAANLRHGPPTDSAAPKASEVTSSSLGTFEGTSSQYNVGFYNETPDSTGHEHHVRQGEVEVTASGADEAVAGAIVTFEEYEDVSSWRDRASSIECVQTEGEA